MFSFKESLIGSIGAVVGIMIGMTVAGETGGVVGALVGIAGATFLIVSMRRKDNAPR